ncbi:MAG: primosomal protein N' [Gemmatimonadaceae bacterium]
MSSRRLVEVALPLPLFRTFTYAAEAEPANPLVPGSRVVVPVRNRRAVGLYLGPAQEGAQDLEAIRAIIDVPDREPALSPNMLALCQWIAQYYVVPIGLAFRSILPAAMSVAGVPRPPRKTQRLVVLARELPSLVERERIFVRARRQRELFDVLESMGGRSTIEHLTHQLGFSASLIRSLADRGLARIEHEVVNRDPFATRIGVEATDHVPTSSQVSALSALTNARPGDVALLYGVTGSGKTLVYIELLREIVRRRGQSAIVLVPEISLTPQTVDRFRAVFGDQVAVLHSALSDGERYDAWLALKTGQRRIAVGARSAIFAPLQNVGAIIVDEEHEATYKNGETPRYHAREVAIVRARQVGALVVLGSATPSVESWHNAQSGKYRLLELPERVGAGRLPSVSVVDLRYLASGSELRHRTARESQFRRVVSEPLEGALTNRIERGEQSILLLNRRGYAAFMQCSECGDVRVCPHCSITLTYHRAPERLVCHYCLHEEARSEKCVRCGGETLQQRGFGTQQVERLMAERYPAARIARMDVDTTSGKWAHAEILDRVGSGEVDVLLGTQMIAKGLDFPNVTLVGVIDADVGINLPDFRASERSFQLLSQVAGRAGRGPKGGEVIIQTRVPGHHAVRFAITHDYRSFVAQELPARRNPLYPPYVRLANVITSGLSEEGTAKLAIKGSDWIRQLLAAHSIDAVVVGPAPCPVQRIKKRWRWHILIKSQQSALLTKVLQFFLDRFDVPATHDLRVVVDRDPVALM